MAQKQSRKVDKDQIKDDQRNFSQIVAATFLQTAKFCWTIKTNRIFISDEVLIQGVFFSLGLFLKSLSMENLG